MTQDTLPAGSKPYGNQYWIDPLGKIWFGNGFEDYRHKADIYTNVQDYSAKADGITDDSEAIQNAINAAGVGGTIYFPEGTYLIKNQLDLLFNQTLLGYGATIKRADESKTTLSVEADAFSTDLTLASVPADWTVGDEIHLFIGQSVDETTAPKKIAAINGNTITLETRINRLINSDTDNVYPVDTGCRKVFSMIESQQSPVPAVTKILGLTFDGNRDNNSANYYWFLNTAVHVYGYGTVVQDCKFIDMPNENIVTQGAKIVNCFASGLNGSFVHLSSPPADMGEGFMGTVIASNVVKGSNGIDPLVTGHSRAVVENSWNAGKTIIIGNRFEGSGMGYAYDFTRGTAGTTDDEEVIVSGNVFKNYSKISNDVGVNQTWEINRRMIVDNMFIDCGTVNYSNLHTKGVLWANNKLFGNTVINNLKTYIDDAYFMTKTLVMAGNPVSTILHDNGTHKIVTGLVSNNYRLQDQTNSKNYIVINMPSEQMTIADGTRIGFRDIVGSKTSAFTVGMTKEELNNAYPVASYPVGTKIMVPLASPPRYYTRLSDTEWCDQNGTMVGLDRESEITGTDVDFLAAGARWKEISADLVLTTSNVIAGIPVEIQIKNTDVNPHTVEITGCPFPDGATNEIPAGGRAHISLQQINGVMDASIVIYS